MGCLGESVDVIERIDRGELRRTSRSSTRTVQRQDHYHDVAAEVGEEMPHMERPQVAVTPEGHQNVDRAARSGFECFS
jgi:hypothetical protein